MAEKKNPGRFTIQFNPGDPKQLSVSELLERQGRHKAQFITNAVLHYVHCSEPPSIPFPVSQVIDQGKLEKMVLEILSRQDKDKQEKPQKEFSDIVEVLTGIPDEPNELESIFGKEGLSAIASTLSAFQRG